MSHVGFSDSLSFISNYVILIKYLPIYNFPWFSSVECHKMMSHDFDNRSFDIL